jgi:hypothetical protein
MPNSGESELGMKRISILGPRIATTTKPAPGIRPTMVHSCHSPGVGGAAAGRKYGAQPATRRAGTQGQVPGAARNSP